MSLFVVYVPDTGHVVGAVNAIGGTPPASVASLVGSALEMRVSLGAGKIAIIPVPTGKLDVLAADDEPRVFADPLAFGVEQVEGADPKPTLVSLRSWAEELTFTADSLVVTVPVPDPIEDTPVLALVSDGQDTHMAFGAIPAGGDTVELPVTVPNGKHGVLVLVAGWAGRLRAVSKP